MKILNLIPIGPSILTTYLPKNHNTPKKIHKKEINGTEELIKYFCDSQSQKDRNSLSIILINIL